MTNESVHEALVAYHEPTLAAAGALAAVAAMRPSGGVLSIWDQKAAGLENACHLAKAAGEADGAGVDPAAIPAAAARPYPATAPNVFLANEAYGPVECFAEGSLAMAENVLYTHLGVPKPAWIPNATYFKEIIFQNATAGRALAKGASHPLGDLGFIAAAAAAAAA